MSDLYGKDQRPLPQGSSDAVLPQTGATAEVPSNIALVKYWGKRDAETQWPANDSLSMTLSVARTITRAAAHDGQVDEIVRAGRVYSSIDHHHDKAVRHINRLRSELGFARRLLVETSNTFPADCGIASSASGLGALTLAAVAAWTETGSFAELAQAGYSLDRLAALARLGSGSACRSMHGGFVHWQAGATPLEQRVGPLTEATAEVWHLADIIVLVSTAAKSVASTAAHAAAWTSPLFEPRLAGLPARIQRVRSAIEHRDLERLGEAIEAEALEMHGVMMSSTPAACYFSEVTGKVLAWLRRERQKRGLAAYFTLDAGPNVHVICERRDSEWVAGRLRDEFPNLELILDAVGPGPSLRKGMNP